MTKFGPKTHLGSAAINWAPYYVTMVNDVPAGTGRQLEIG